MIMKKLNFRGYDVTIDDNGKIDCNFQSDSLSENLLFTRSLVKYLYEEGFNDNLEGLIESIDEKLNG